MAKIHNTDIIFATLVNKGRILSTVCLSGISSIGEVVNILRESVGNDLGLSSVTVRNSTRGWSSTAQLYLR